MSGFRYRARGKKKHLNAPWSGIVFSALKFLIVVSLLLGYSSHNPSLHTASQHSPGARARKPEFVSKEKLWPRVPVFERHIYIYVLCLFSTVVTLELEMWKVEVFHMCKDAYCMYLGMWTNEVLHIRLYKTLS